MPQFFTGLQQHQHHKGDAGNDVNGYDQGIQDTTSSLSQNNPAETVSFQARTPYQHTIHVVKAENAGSVLGFDGPAVKNADFSSCFRQQRHEGFADNGMGFDNFSWPGHLASTDRVPAEHRLTVLSGHRPAHVLACWGLTSLLPGAALRFEGDWAVPNI